MKCGNCGANIQIEDEKCPFCGTLNPLAVKHRQDMQRYQKEFQDAKKKVEQRSIRFTALSVKLTVIAVLFAAVIGMFYAVNDGVYKIWRYQTHTKITRHREEYTEKLAAYERDGDWNSFYAFMVENSLTNDETFEEYYVLYHTTFNYGMVMEYLMHYMEEPEYYTVDNLAGRVAGHLEDFYHGVNRSGNFKGDYYSECYTDVHKEALERMNKDMEVLLMTYAGLTPEEIDTLPDYSEKRQITIIEEGLLRTADNANAEDTE